MPYCSICGNETIAIPFSDHLAHVCNTVGCQLFAQGGNYERIGGDPALAGIEPFTNGNNGRRPAPNQLHLRNVYKENYALLKSHGASSEVAGNNRSDTRTAAFLAKLNLSRQRETIYHGE